MRVAALYDIHGNLPALEAVLADTRLAAADAIVVGGDIAPGPQCVEVFDLLLARNDVRFVRGNADRAVLGGEDPSVPAEVMAQVRWSTERLGERLREIARWPLTTTLDVVGLGDVLFCHATPRADDELVTPATPTDDVAVVLAGTHEATVVCGHIHVQYDRLVAGTRVVGAGSVGRPNERPPGAYWLLLGGSTLVEHLRTDYDVERTLAGAAAAGYPSGDLGPALREPPDREETIATFESWRGA